MNISEPAQTFAEQAEKVSAGTRMSLRDTAARLAPLLAVAVPVGLGVYQRRQENRENAMLDAQVANQLRQNQRVIDAYRAFRAGRGQPAAPLDQQVRRGQVALGATPQGRRDNIRYRREF